MAKKKFKKLKRRDIEEDVLEEDSWEPEELKTDNLENLEMEDENELYNGNFRDWN